MIEFLRIFGNSLGFQKRNVMINTVVINSSNFEILSKVLRLVKNTHKVLSDQLLTVSDPDNSPSDLVYSVLNSNAPADMEGKIPLNRTSIHLIFDFRVI